MSPGHQEDAPITIEMRVMGWQPIAKPSSGWVVPPNPLDCAATRAGFSWDWEVP